MTPCRLEQRETGAWCLDCKRHHRGHTLVLSQQLTPLAQAYRDLWQKKRGSQKVDAPKKLLRSLPIARQCRHLDPHRLTNEEAKGLSETARKLDTSCRQCSGQTTLQRCHGGGGHDGYTTLAWCTGKCDRWEAKANVAQAALYQELPDELPVNGEWIKDPNVWALFRSIIQKEKEGFRG